MDEDDAFLYGDAPAPAAEPPKPAPPALAPADDGQDMDQGDESSEDDVEIILDADPSASAPQPSYGRGVPYALRAQHQLNVGSTPFTPAPATPSGPVQNLRPVPTLAQPGVPVQPHPPPSLPAEPTKPAIVDGDQKITEVDLDSLDDKPWRRPGAHQADYFNYGFDEFTWKAHCARQRDTRSESDRARDQPFSIFATMPVQEAWNTLPPALKGALTTIVFQAVQGQGNMMPFGGMMPGMPAGMPPMGMPPGAGLPQPPHPSMHQAPSGTGQDDGFRGQKRGRGDQDDGDYAGDDGSSYGGSKRGGSRFDQNDRYNDRRRRDDSDAPSDRPPIPSRPSRDVSPMHGGSRGGKLPPKGPRASGREQTGSYRDKDAYGASNDGLDYGYDRDPRSDYSDAKRRK